MASTVLKDIGLYKNNLITLLQSNPDICECILDKKTYVEEEVDNMIYDQMFPFLYIENTQDKVRSYICLEVDVPRIPTGTVKDMKIIIWVYCHKDCMKYYKKDFSGTRVDVLSDMVDRTLCDSDDFGIGKLKLDSVTYLNNANADYYGRQMIYSCPDFKIKR